MTSASGRAVETSTRPRAGTGLDWPVVALVFASLLAYSYLARPTPSVNEPHYLCKAKHYWQPEWCAGDFFLNSSNPHWVFYQTVGVLTVWLSFPVAAWVGRVIVLGLLAWGWTRLTARLLPERWAPFAAVSLFLLLQALGNFSGEWLVGGVESKVIAYALALAGMSYLIDRRPVPAGACLGIAISFHPVVGSWCVISLLLAAVIRLLKSRFLIQQGDEPTTSRTDSGEQATIKAWLIGVGLLVVCALPGVIPAVQMLGGMDPAAVAHADRIQVGLRLSHHLDPMSFPLSAYRYYSLLIVIAWMTRSSVPQTTAWRWFVSIVTAAGFMAVVGVLIGWGPRPLQEMPLADLRVWLLKFYPFRLADLLIPMLVACSIVHAGGKWFQAGSGSTWREWGGRAAVASALGLALVLPSPDRNPSRMTEKRENDWRDACAWIQAESTPESLLYAANEDWAVKWFCHRAEYVNYKDCPQDAAGILEWLHRLTKLKTWLRTTFQDGRCSAWELQALYEQTGITHLLVSRLGPIDVEPVYQNESFRVYETVGRD